MRRVLIALALAATLGAAASAQNTGVLTVSVDPAGAGITVNDDVPNGPFGSITSLIFENCTVANTGAGEVTVTCSVGGGGGDIEVREVDGTPSVDPATVLEFLQSSGFAVTDQGAGVARVDFTLPTDSVGTGELADGADTPTAGHYLRVATGGLEIEYRTTAEVLADIGALDATHTADADAHREHASLEESSEIDADIAAHTSVVDAHFDHADTLAELNTQIGATVADGPHDGIGTDTLDDLSDNQVGDLSDVSETGADAGEALVSNGAGSWAPSTATVCLSDGTNCPAGADTPDAEEDNSTVVTDATAFDFGSGFDVAVDGTEADVTLDATESPLSALEESAEIDSDVAAHTAVVDAHFDHADDLAELNTQIGASLADGPHTTDTHATVEEDNVTVASDPPSIDFGSGFDVTLDTTEADVTLDVTEAPLAALEESAEIDSDIATHASNADAHREHASLEESAEIDSDITAHAAVVDAHFDHADNLTELNAQIGASLADGAHTVDTRVSVEEDNVEEQTDTGSIDFGAQFNVACAAGECDVTVDTVAGVAGADADDLSDDTIAAHASSTSSNLAGVLSDETGSGAAVFGTSPTIATPTLTLLDSTAPTADGELQYDSTVERLQVGDDGAATLEFYPGAHSDTSGLEEEAQIGSTDVTGNAADDQMLIGTAANAATWKALPAGGTDGCSGTGDKPIYTASTNTWSCGADAGAGGGMTSFTAQADDSNTLTITDGETLDVAGALGLQTTAAAGSPEQLTVAFDYSETLAGNPALGAEECVWSSDGAGGVLLCEGATADTVEGLIVWSPTTSDRTLTLPDATGTVATTADIHGDGGNCAAGSYPLGVDASGAVQDCTDATTEIDSAIATHAAIVDSHFDHADNLTELNTQIGATLADGPHFSPNADPGVDHSSYVAGHADGANCATAGEWPAGVDAAGAVQGCGSVLPANVSPTTDGQLTWDTTAETLKVGDDGVATLSIATGAHFSPNSDPGVDHAGYVAGHGDGGNCAAGEIPLGVDGSGAVQGCYEPSEADITDLAHFTPSADPGTDHASYVAGHVIEDNDVPETQRPTLNLISGGTVTVACADDAGNSETDCTFTGSAHTVEVNDLTASVTWANVPDANVDGGNERDEVLVAAAGGTDLTCAAGVCNVDNPVTAATSATTATTADNLAADGLDAMSEIAAGIKRGPDATDTHLLTTDVATPASPECLEMDTDGSIILSGAACAAGGGDEVLIDTVAVADAAGVDLTSGTYVSITHATAPSPDTATFDVSLSDLQRDDLSDDAITALSGVSATTGTGTTVVFSAGPALTGDPTVPTATGGDSDTSAASTAFVGGEIATHVAVVDAHFDHADNLTELNTQIGASLADGAHTTDTTCSTAACDVGTDDTLTLPQSAAPVPTIEGRVEWDTDDLLVVGDGVGQATFYPGAHFTPNADPGVDHSSYVAGHSDGANCAAGEIPLGVDAAGAVQGCYEPTEADITDLSHFTPSADPGTDHSGYVAGHVIEDNDVPETQRPTLNLLSGGTVTVSCADDAGNSETDCTFTGSAHTVDTTCNDAGVNCLFAGSASEGGSATSAAALDADALDAMSEIAAGIKRGPDATDTHVLTTDVAIPGSPECLQMDTDGSVTLSGGTCGGSPTFDAIGTGTNTTATMTVGSGASIVASGTGEVRSTGIDDDGDGTFEAYVSGSDFTVDANDDTAGDWTLSSTVLAASNSTGARIENAPASSTNPTVNPSKGDVDTGLGWTAADQLALIAGGTEGVTVAEGAYGTSAEDTVVWINDVVTAPTTNPTGGVLLYSDGDSLYIRDTTGATSDLAASGGSPAFTDITTGTNTTATMTVGTGASIVPSGTGAIKATAINPDNDANSEVRVSGTDLILNPNDDALGDWYFNSSQFYHAIGGGMVDSNTSATDPSLIPLKSANTTGIGSGGSSQVSIINNGVESARFNTAASGVNYVSVTPGATTVGPTIAAAGSDTNVNLSFASKGTGYVRLSAGTKTGWQITDSGSNVQALMGQGGGPQLHKSSSAAAPALSFEGGATWSDMGFYRAAADTIGISTDATQRMTIGPSGETVATIVLDEATGNEVAHNISYTTNKATSGDDTGLVVNQTDTLSPGTSLLADFQVGGASKVNIDNVGQLTLPLVNDAANPTLAFGDGDTGWYEQNDDQLALSMAGADKLEVTVSLAQFGPTNASPGIDFSPASSATDPVFLPAASDQTTGIGGNAGEVSVIAGGVTAINAVTAASGVNYVNVTPAAAGAGPTVAAAGSDTNIDLSLAGKGNGRPGVRNGSGQAAFELVSNAASISVLNLGDTAQPSAGQVSYANAADQLRFATGATQRMTIGPSGEVAATIVLDEATGNEVAHNISYTTNKATSGDDTGLVVNQTDTLSPGTSLLADFQVGGVSQASISNTGNLALLGTVDGVDIAAHDTDIDAHWDGGADDQIQLGSGASTAVFATIPDCNTESMLTYTQATNTWGCETDNDSAPAFSAITTGTNTTATMTVGTGASIVASGTGEVRATGIDDDGDGTHEIQAASALIYLDPNDDGGADWRMSSTDFYGSDSLTGAVLNEASSATNPTLIPSYWDGSGVITGIGGLAGAGSDYVSIISESVEGLRVNTAASGVTYVDVTPGATGVAPTIKAAGEANTSLMLATTGASSSIQLDPDGDGTREWNVTASVLQGWVSGSGGIRNSAASTTSPGIVPSGQDIDTGIGRDSATGDAVTIVAGGDEAWTFYEGAAGTSAGDSIAFVSDVVTAPTSNPTGGVYLYSDANTLYIRDTTGTVTDVLGAGTETNDLEANDPPTIADTEIYVGNGAGSGTFVVVSGDASLANTGALTISAGVVEETMMSTEDFGDFSCGAGADDCVLDAGVVDNAALASPQKTRMASFNVESPTTSDDGLFQAKLPDATTLVRVSCSSSGGSGSIQFYERAENSPNTGTTSMLTSDLTCNSDTTADATTSFSDSAVAADSVIALGIKSDSWGPSDMVRVFVEYTVD